MDLSNPLATVTPTLDAAVLQVLAATSGASTGAHVHRLAGVGSDDGVRRVLGRLVRQGIVFAEEHSHATLYQLNRNHVASKHIVALTQVRSEIIEHIRTTVRSWNDQPAHVSLFGSFARGTADAESDIDVLVIWDRVDTEEVATLSRDLHLFTGNLTNVLELTPMQVIELLRVDDPIIGSWRSDEIHLAGARIMDLLRSLDVQSGHPLEVLQ